MKRTSKASAASASQGSRGRGRKKAASAPRTPRHQPQVERRLGAVLGATARTARMRSGLTQADVAERIGIATEVYGRLERGRMLPSVPTLWRLCSVLRVSSDEFLGLMAEQAPSPPGRSRVRFSGDEPTEADERPEMRRLVRSLRKLSRPELKLMNLVAGAIHSRR